MGMRHTLSDQSAIESVPISTRRQATPTAVLWTIQGLLALLFLAAGGMKLFLPLAVVLAQMPVPLPGSFVRFIGAVEVAGALGLILPGLLRIQPRLTPLAASGLAVEMIGATVVTLLGGKGAAALFPIVVGLLCAAVAYGRRSWGWV
jgi:DoxX-like protein